MLTATERLLTDRLADFNVRDIDPHEVARELTILYNTGNYAGVRQIRDAYLIGQGRLYPNKTVDEITAAVDGNLMFASRLADAAASCGYGAGGQQHVKPKHDGPVAQFYRDATGCKREQ